MFSDLNPFDRETAILEIVIMLLGAFLIGFITAWLVKRTKQQGEQPGAMPPVVPLADKERKLREELRAKVKELAAQKNEAEAKVDLLTLEVKALKTRQEKAEIVPPVMVQGESPKDQTALQAQVKSLEQTLAKNKAELARMDAMRDQIAELQSQLKVAEASSNTEVHASSTGGVDNRELVRIKAELAIQEAAARRYESQNRQLKTAKESLTKERDRALEQLETLQVRMDKLQRQVESIRTNTREQERKSMERGVTGSKGRDLNQLTSLKGLGYRSLEFLERLGINTMERLSQTDANTIQHIAKKLDKPVEMVEGWVKSAQNKVDNG